MKKPPNENYKIRKSVVSILEQEKTYSTSSILYYARYLSFYHIKKQLMYLSGDPRQ